MLTALVQAPASAFELAATLATLVPGAVDGILREVVLVDAVGPDVEAVAEHAGCRVLRSADVLAPDFMPKGEWLLLVGAGARLPAGWIEAAARHMGEPGRRPAGRIASRAARSFPASLLPAPAVAWVVPAQGSLAYMRARRQLGPGPCGARVSRLRPDPHN